MTSSSRAIVKVLAIRDNSLHVIICNVIKFDKPQALLRYLWEMEPRPGFRSLPAFDQGEYIYDRIGITNFF